ncbi:MAG: ABC transporter permease, partial [Phyllobacterium sp.]|nr:ABC transporter permease [Phyllobacterium sp.]
DPAAARDDADRPEIAADDAGASALAEAAQKEVERDAAYQEGKGLGADPRHIVPAEGRQMDRSNDPAVTRDLDASAPEAALYGGFTERQVVFSTLLISGGLAGLAGVLDVAGPNGQLTDRISVGYGFTAIIVAFLGQLHPLGIVIASVVMAATYIGGEQIQFEIGMSASITSVFQGLLLLNFLAFQLFVDYRVEWKHPSWKRGGQPLQASRRLSQAAGK